jgi:2-polyprenyl-3-methyl-5-hydroxy-6-metoxy-1,4-benzoquinol methylase
MMIEEVHLWRGTAAERALRSQLVKSTQFAYFDEQLDHPEWSGKTVLDFGGNKGNLLRDPACAIDQRDYYCVDVISEAIEEGRRAFPEAHWIHYDRYNRSFNPEGVRDLPVPDLGLRFDFILAYSVFTHTTLEEMKDLVAQLEALLAPRGTLAFTFIDPHWNGNLEWRVRGGRGLGGPVPAGLLARTEEADWCSLVNGSELYVNSSGPWDLSSDTCATYNVYYSERFFRQQFPRVEVRKPVNGERQHCAILRKDVAK